MRTMASLGRGGRGRKAGAEIGKGGVWSAALRHWARRAAGEMGRGTGPGRGRGHMPSGSKRQQRAQPHAPAEAARGTPSAPDDIIFLQPLFLLSVLCSCYVFRNVPYVWHGRKHPTIHPPFFPWSTEPPPPPSFHQIFFFSTPPRPQPPSPNCVTHLQTVGVSDDHIYQMENIPDIEDISCDVDHTRLQLKFHSEITAAQWYVKLNVRFRGRGRAMGGKPTMAHCCPGSTLGASLLLLSPGPHPIPSVPSRCWARTFLPAARSTAATSSRTTLRAFWCAV